MLTRRSTVALALLFAVGSAQAHTVVAKTHTAATKAHAAKAHTTKAHTTKTHTAKAHTAKAHTSKAHTAKAHAAKAHTAKTHTVAARKHAKRHVWPASVEVAELAAVAQSPLVIQPPGPMAIEVAGSGPTMPWAAGAGTGSVAAAGSVFSVPVLAQSPLNWGQKPVPAAYGVLPLRIGSASTGLAMVHTPMQPIPALADRTIQASAAEESQADDTVDTVTALRDALVDLAMSLRDIPYVSGGATPSSGFDCSGFVRYVFAHVTGMQLPANAASQFLAGLKVSRGRLKPGDLVFFHTRGKRRISHVGIYLSDGRFIHAPTTGKSVEVSSLYESYWARHFAGARRPAAIVAAANNG